MLVYQKANLEQDSTVLKVHPDPIEKERKVSQQRFYEHYGQHSHNGCKVQHSRPLKH